MWLQAILEEAGVELLPGAKDVGTYGTQPYSRKTRICSRVRRAPDTPLSPYATMLLPAAFNSFHLDAFIHPDAAIQAANSSDTRVPSEYPHHPRDTLLDQLVLLGDFDAYAVD
jgi:hypothetical protein